MAASRRAAFSDSSAGFCAARQPARAWAKMKNASTPNQMSYEVNAHSANRMAPAKPMMLAAFKLRIGPILSQSSPRTI